jgi:hypothetical protein
MVIEISPQPMSMLKRKEVGDIWQSCGIRLVVVPLAGGTRQVFSTLVATEAIISPIDIQTPD